MSLLAVSVQHLPTLPRRTGRGNSSVFQARYLRSSHIKFNRLCTLHSVSTLDSLEQRFVAGASDRPTRSPRQASIRVGDQRMSDRGQSSSC
ncbi:hypothetical protein WJX74_010049 [Apatococcus lobatus]|uniref:Uncharacterized protein n=1 Tax=Apatococcus lobatus TaxID=904363 RepID=A0AAW1S7R1_9CHLO